MDLRRSSIGGSTTEYEILRAEIWHLGLTDDVLCTVVVFKQNANTDVKTYRPLWFTRNKIPQFRTDNTCGIKSSENVFSTKYRTIRRRFMFRRVEFRKPMRREISEIKNNHYSTDNYTTRVPIEIFQLIYTACYPGHGYYYIYI